MAMPFLPPGANPGAGPAQPQMQPTPQQIQAFQQQFHAEAARQGLSPQQLAEKLRQHAMAQQQQAQQSGKGQGQQSQPAGGGQGGGGGGGQVQTQQQQQVPLQPGPPKPEALAVAKFLRNQELKSRACILQEKRKDMFKVKRAIRALLSPAYVKARSKNPLLPEVHNRATAENAFKLLPLSMLAIRVSKIDTTSAANPAHGQPGHKHGASGKSKSVKKGGVWSVKIEQQQDVADQCHYVWFYDGPQIKQKLYALGVLLLILTVVLFPLWPLKLRQGVWYLSMGCLGLLGAFFGLAIVRLILFLVTVALGPAPGIWIYPNLFEDVGFFDSFRPGWDWRETKESQAAKKAEKKAKKQAKKDRKAGKITSATSSGAVTAESSSANGSANATGPKTARGKAEKKNLSAKVEEVDDE